MSQEKNYIDIGKIEDMLFHDDQYIREFVEATIQSFKEYSASYGKFLLIKDETNFRKAGHKIKPVALMLEIRDIVDEYEHAKTLLHNQAGQRELKRSVTRTQNIISRVNEELTRILESLKS